MVEQRRGDEVRIAGEWRSIRGLHRPHPDLMPNLARLAAALPGWDMLEGLDLGLFTPMPHQLLAADMFATPWLGDLGEGLAMNRERTRLIVADEGGTGKTLTSSIAARWVDLYGDVDRGPIVVLCPRILMDEWVRHLRATFHDDPERVLRLGSALWFDATLHRDAVVVVSKHSWAKHWGEHVSRMVESCPPALVIIDEVHQGRSRYADEDGEEPDDEGSGGGETDRVDDKTLHAAQHGTCRWSGFAIGVSATPINLHIHEFGNILSMLKHHEAEEIESVETDDAVLQPWMALLGELQKIARGSITPTRPMADIKPIFDAMARIVRARGGPLQRWGLVDEDVDTLATNLEQCSEQATEVQTSDLLRMARELHPWGRNLLMTLRSDIETAEGAFRTRKEVHLKVDWPELANLAPNLTRNDTELNAADLRLLLSDTLNPFRMREVQTKDGGTKRETRYKGVWRKGESDQQIERSSLKLPDPRLPVLAQLIADDVQRSTHATDHVLRGCVVFTEWRGTADGFAKRDLQNPLERHFLEAGIDVDVAISVRELTAGTQDPAAVLRDCRREARQSNRYPILVCTSAGEVGLNMEWATTLVHWDLHPNPQKLEQRTWRLDRRLRENDGVRRDYRVVTMTVVDANLDVAYTEYRDRIESRYRSACESLGTVDDEHRPTYLPGTDTEDRHLPFIPSRSSASIIDKDLQALASFFQNRLDENGSYAQALENAKFRSTFNAQMLCSLAAGHQFMTSSLLKEGCRTFTSQERASMLQWGAPWTMRLHAIARHAPPAALVCAPHWSSDHDGHRILAPLGRAEGGETTSLHRRLPDLRIPLLRGLFHHLSHGAPDPEHIPEVHVDVRGLSSTLSPDVIGATHTVYVDLLRLLLEAHRVVERDRTALVRGGDVMFIEGFTEKETVDLLRSGVISLMDGGHTMTPRDTSPERNWAGDLAFARIEQLSAQRTSIVEALQGHKHKKTEEHHSNGLSQEEIHERLNTDPWRTRMSARCAHLERTVGLINGLLSTSSRFVPVLNIKLMAGDLHGR